MKLRAMIACVGVLLSPVCLPAASQNAAQPPASPSPLIVPPSNSVPLTADAEGDFTIAAPYAPAPELTVADGVPRGTVREFTMDSADSKIYPGIARNQPGEVVPYTSAG